MKTAMTGDQPLTCDPPSRWPAGLSSYFLPGAETQTPIQNLETGLPPSGI